MPALPDNFTLEFDLLVPPRFNSSYLLNASITELSDVRQIAQWQTASNRFTFTAWPGGPTWHTSWTSRIEANTTGGTTGGVNAETKSPWKSDPVHVAVTRQGARMRVYFNQEKMWDVTEGAAPGRKIQRHRLLHSECRCRIGVLVSNVRLAVGAPDTRNKLLTEGKFVTHGILFDVNSASLKPESYGTLKEVAGVLTENAHSKVTDRRPHRFGWRHRAKPGSVEAPRRVGSGGAGQGILDRRGPHDDRRQGRGRTNRQEPDAGRQGQQPAGRVHQAAMTPLTRRQAISALAALPFAAVTVTAQTRPGPKHRVILGNQLGLLLAPDGTLQMWVRDPAGDGTAPSSLGLGHNGPLQPFTLATVPGLSNIVAASAGWNCTFAVLADGRLLAWGKNPSGWLGTTTQAQMETLASWSPNESNTPLPQSVRFDAVDVSSGDDHSMALTRDGGVYTWGAGTDGQLGIGPMPVIQFRTRTPAPMRFMPMPVRVPDLGEVTAIAAGGRHSLALLKDGTVRAWGYNRYGKWATARR